jgi:hypothetical protein
MGAPLPSFPEVVGFDLLAVVFNAVEVLFVTLEGGALVVVGAEVGVVVGETVGVEGDQTVGVEDTGVEGGGVGVFSEVLVVVEIYAVV